MANYNITLSDGTTIVTVNEAAVNTDYSVPLVGQNATTYGDDVAAAFLRSLENFASPLAPENNTTLGGAVTVLKGQLWFDTANNVLKVNTGATGSPVWESMAPTPPAGTDNSVLRWDGTSWSPEERVQVSATGTLSIWDAGTDNVTLAHNGADLVVTNASGTDNVLWEGFTGDFRLRDSMELWVSGGPGNAQSIELVPYDVALGDFVGKLRTVGLTKLRIGSSISTLSVDGSLSLKERGTAYTDELTFGQVWVNSSDKGLYYTNESGTDVRIDVSAGGTVTASGSPLNNRVAHFTSDTNVTGDAAFTWDGTSLEATQFAGIAKANLVDKSAAETITNVWTFNSTVLFNADLDLQDNDRIRFGNTDDVDVDFDGTDFVIAGNSAVDFNINSFSGSLNLNGVDLLVDSAGEVITLQTTANDASASHYISWRDNDNTEKWRIGKDLTAGGDGNDLVIRHLTGSLDQFRLMMSSTDNAIVAVAGGSVTLYYDNTSSIVTQPAAADNTSRGAVKDIGGSWRNIGFNETPGLYMGVGTYIPDEADVGKYLHRKTIGSSTTVQLTNDANIPNGATWIVSNWLGAGDNSTCTITTSGATLYWLDGGGGSTATTGTRTLARQGVCTIRKHSDTEYHIWGAGLS